MKRSVVLGLLMMVAQFVFPQSTRKFELEKAKTHCPYCHQPHDKTARFCPNCGERLIFDNEEN